MRDRSSRPCCAGPARAEIDSARKPHHRLRRAMLAFVLRQRRVIAQTMAVNAGSRAAMEAVGMRYVRTCCQRWDDPLPGAELGEVEYEVTREAWLARLWQN